MVFGPVASHSTRTSAAGKQISSLAWWRNQMETFSALLAILCVEFTGHRWIPRTKASDAALMFCLICVWINGWLNNREAGDLRRYRAHCGVIVMVYTRRIEKNKAAGLQTSYSTWYAGLKLYIVKVTFGSNRLYLCIWFPRKHYCQTKPSSRVAEVTVTVDKLRDIYVNFARSIPSKILV